MTTDCIHCPLRTKPVFDPLSEDELSFMQKFKVGELSIEAGAPLLMEGSNSPQLFTALRGLGLRFKILPNGNRQVVNFVFPGDFIGLQAGVMGEMQHSVSAASKMTLCVFDRSELWNFFRNHPERGFDLTWLAAMEEHLLGEALVTIGQRSAIEAVAWVLVRIFQRCDAVGMRRGQSVPMPFTQQDLADALGLSLVHTNKTLGKLRDRQLARWSDGELSIMDIKPLADLSGMDLEKVKTRPLI